VYRHLFLPAVLQELTVISQHAFRAGRFYSLAATRRKFQEFKEKPPTRI
jgi:hypothetical protein